jgi:cysteinyl-tRNA synthetase
MFPHHENEIAQSEAATGCTFAKLWMHNGPLRVDNEKMSKSLNNFFTVREVLKEYDGEVVRQLLIASHYRSPINYSPQSLQQAAKVLKRLYTALKDLDVANAKSLTNSRFEKAFLAAMDDDFNTPKAFAVLFDMVKEINRQKSADMESASQLGALLVKLGGHLGLLQSQPQDFLRGEVNPQQVEQLIAAREQARADKDWARADQIRDQLSAMQVVVEDGADGSSWRLNR